MDADATTRFVPEHRRTGFKNRDRFKTDELRRRHEEAQVEIRKAKREENLAKRRNMTDININDSDSEDESEAMLDVQVCTTNWRRIWRTKGGYFVVYFYWRTLIQSYKSIVYKLFIGFN